MGRGGYDILPPDSYSAILNKLFTPKHVEQSKLDTKIEKERRRRDHWHYQYGFHGQRASETERGAEDERKNNFCRSLNVMTSLPRPKKPPVSRVAENGSSVR
jgi:hypothetical protein